MSKHFFCIFLQWNWYYIAFLKIGEWAGHLSIGDHLGDFGSLKVNWNGGLCNVANPIKNDMAFLKCDIFLVYWVQGKGFCPPYWISKLVELKSQDDSIYETDINNYSENILLDKCLTYLQIYKVYTNCNMYNIQVSYTFSSSEVIIFSWYLQVKRYWRTKRNRQKELSLQDDNIKCISFTYAKRYKALMRFLH